ncbi:uncharacterized protein VTP21DRAFT_8576 [Calcarisporiella thermophila]|uniref:uncharacterized protein n=1 Tax=Calcarisporiella thermophila TaxID=911321 RepID=UPI00374313DB
MTVKTRALVMGMLVTGVLNTILNKYQDNVCVENCDSPDPAARRYFEQPVFQTLTMFIGEAACLLAFQYGEWLQRRRAKRNGAAGLGGAGNEAEALLKDEGDGLPLTGWRKLLLWLPTLCDLTGTTIMNVGLLLTAASVYQMLRGSIVLFVGLFSVVFLKRRFFFFQWYSLFLVVLGVGLVGLSSALFPQQRPEAANPTLAEEVPFHWESVVGVLLVLGAQVFTASQFVIEEKLMSRYSVYPVVAVGLEGAFGLITVLTAMPILHFTLGVSHPGGYFDVVACWRQVLAHPELWASSIAFAASISFFNFFGLSVTRAVSATARSTIDTCRTLFIWMVSLSLGWERFAWLQVVGFSLLIYGTFIFNGVVEPPCFAPPLEPDVEELPAEATPLLPEDHEHR